jgi:putative hydrolase of HD superfamily
MPTPTPPETAAVKIAAHQMIELGRLVLKFGEVNRATFHPDGTTPETDTTHTVMLGLVAYSMMPSQPNLEPTLVLLYALVHDLVEAYAGDTNTAFISTEDRARKAEAEREAFSKLSEEYIEIAPWLVLAIQNYEIQISPEARFIRYLDKAMPKITHTLNGCATIKGMGRTREDIEQAHTRQLESLNAEYPELSETLGPVMREMMDRTIESWVDEPAQPIVVGCQVRDTQNPHLRPVVRNEKQLANILSDNFIRGGRWIYDGPGAHWDESYGYLCGSHWCRCAQ